MRSAILVAGLLASLVSAHNHGYYGAAVDAPKPKHGEDVYTTVIEKFYETICPTGISTATTQVTTEVPVTYTMSTIDLIMTTTVETCMVGCGHGPTEVTLTIPLESYITPIPIPTITGDVLVPTESFEEPPSTTNPPLVTAPSGTGSLPEKSPSVIPPYPFLGNSTTSMDGTGTAPVVSSSVTIQPSSKPPVNTYFSTTIWDEAVPVTGIPSTTSIIPPYHAPGNYTTIKGTGTAPIGTAPITDTAPSQTLTLTYPEKTITYTVTREETLTAKPATVTIPGATITITTSLPDITSTEIVPAKTLYDNYGYISSTVPESTITIIIPGSFTTSVLPPTVVTAPPETVIKTITDVITSTVSEEVITTTVPANSSCGSNNITQTVIQTVFATQVVTLTKSMRVVETVTVTM